MVDPTVTEDKPLEPMSLFADTSAPEPELNLTLFPADKAAVEEQTPIKLASVDFVTEGMGLSSPDQDTTVAQDRIRDTDIAKQNKDKLDKAVGLLGDASRSSAERAALAREEIAKPTKVRTVGQAYVEQNSPTHPKKEELIRILDEGIRDLEDKKSIQKNVDGSAEGSWTDFLNKPRAWLANFTSQEAGKKVLEQTIANLVSPALALSVKGTDAPKEVKDAAAKFGDDKLIQASTLGKFNTLKDYIEYINPVEYENSMDIEWGKFFTELKQSGTVSEQFKTAMKDKYGPEWGTRFTAFGLKEIGTDAMILATAALNPAIASEMFAGKDANLAARAKAVIARSSALAVGGASSQSVQNQILGEDSNFIGEAAGRFVGNIAGEGVFKAASTAYKGIKSIIAENTAKIAEKAGLPVYSKESVAKLKDLFSDKSSVAVALVKSAAYQYSKDFMRLQGEVAEGLLVADAKQAVTIRARLSELTGLADKELETTLGLGNKIYGDQLFKDIEKAPEYIKAAADLTKATEQKNILEKEAERLTKLKERTQTRFDKAPIMTEKGNAVREARMAEIDAQLKDATDGLTEVSGNLEGLTAKVAEGQNMVLTTGSTLADKAALGKAMGFRVMGESANKQHSINDIWLSYLNDAGENQFRPFSGPDTFRNKTAASLFKYTQDFKRVLHISEPEMIAGSVAQDFSDAVNKTNEHARVFRKMMNTSLEKLGTKEQAGVFGVLKEGADKEMIFQPEELLMRGLSPKQVDSYYAIRKTLDFAHMTMDRSLVSEFSAKGAKSYNGVPVNVVKQADAVLTPDKIKDGFVRVREIMPTGNREAFDAIVREAELKELTSVLPAHAGYLPIVYKDARFHVSVIDPANGSVKRVGAYPKVTQAIEGMRNYKAAPGEIVIYNEWDAIQGVGSVGFNKSSMPVFETLDDASAAGLREALKKAGIDNEDRIRLVMDQLDLSSMRRKFIGQRAETRLAGPDGKPAELAATDEAIAEYLQSVANRAGMADWRAHAIETFKEQYKNVLDPARPWYDRGAILDQKQLGLTDGKLVREAEAYQKWLDRTISGKTQHEKRMENYFRTTAADWAEQGGAKGAAIKALDALPTVREFTNSMRMVGSVPKLLTFAVAQVAVQGSQAAVTVGAHPIHAFHGMQDIMRAVGAKIAKEGGARPTKEGAQILYAMERSGYLADISTVDLYDFVQTTRGPVANFINKSGIGKIAETPFRMGEAMNRAMAFATTRRELLEKAAKGTLNGIDGKPFKGAIDDEQFLKLVTDKAKVMALDMGKSGQLEAFSGAGSVLLQFKQVLPKATHIFETNKLSVKEKLGAAAALTGLWGIDGLPVVSDLVTFGDWAGYQLSDKKPSSRQLFSEAGRRGAAEMGEYIADLTDADYASYGTTKKAVERFLKKGAIYSATEGEVDLVNRVALGKFITEMGEVQSAEDYIVSVSVLTDFADAVKKSGVMHSIPAFLEYSYHAAKGMPKEEIANRMFDGYLPQYLRGERTGPETAAKMGNEFGQVFSYMGSLTRMLEAQHREAADPYFRRNRPDEPNFYTTSGGKTTSVEPNFWRSFQYGVGITPGKVVEDMTIQQMDAMYSEAAKEYRAAQLQRFANAPASSSREIMAETVAELSRFQHLLIDENIKGKISKNFVKSTIDMFVKDTVQRGTPTLRTLKSEE